MASKYSVLLRTIVKENGLEPLHTSSDYDTRLLTVADVNRPALQLAGFYNYFDPNRLQIIGRVESTYLELKTEAERRSCFEELMRYDISALVICHGASVFPECLEVAEKYDRNLFVTPEDTSDFMADVISSLHTHLAPRTTMHGVLVEVHGEGVLLTELIRYYMELRGIGVVDVRHLYGVGAVKPEGAIDLVVNLEVWDDQKAYDRLGLISETQDILGVTVPSVTIPVRPGRNLAVILELAAMNNRQKKMGYNAAETLASNVDHAVDNGTF